MTNEKREQMARDRAARYAETPLSVLLREAAGHCDCRCRYPDGSGPPCGREQLANELLTRAAAEERLEAMPTLEGGR